MSFLVSEWLEVVLAQAPAAAEAASAAPTRPGAEGSVLRFLMEGGPWVLVNLFWLAVSLGVALERVTVLMFRYQLNASPFMAEVTKLVMTGNVDRAVRLCGAAPYAPLARVLRAGLSRAHHGELEVSRALEEALLEHTLPVKARIPWLLSLAVIATLVGLVGTVFGLIGTLQSLDTVPAAQHPALLSSGIARAMSHTAFGLCSAVVCVSFHLLLSSYAEELVERVRLNALKLEHLLARRAAGESAREAEAKLA